MLVVCFDCTTRLDWRARRDFADDHVRVIDQPRSNCAGDVACGKDASVRIG